MYHPNRIKTREVKIGNVVVGNFNPILVQTMTTTNTMHTKETVEQSIRCIEAGAQLIRITAPSKTEAENLQNIKDQLRKRGYHTPLVADIHFTPNAAEIAARIVEKVRVNPGNYVDKKKFEQIEYTDAEYAEEIDRITERFTPLITICKAYGTAMRIGTNHGSLSDRIMSRYGDTPIGMVESAMEFLRIARAQNYHQIVLSMKSSNPKVMVQAYRLLIQKMEEEFAEIYPLHLGVTEAGDGEDGRIKSAIGIGALLEDGIGDTIRVSLTEDPELEIPVCKNLVNRYKMDEKQLPVAPPSKMGASTNTLTHPKPETQINSNGIQTTAVQNIGGGQVPVVVAEYSKMANMTPADLEPIGYRYHAATDKWNISDAAADYIFTNYPICFPLPGTLKVILPYQQWVKTLDKPRHTNQVATVSISDVTKEPPAQHGYPIMDAWQYVDETCIKSTCINFVMLDCFSHGYPPTPLPVFFSKIKKDNTVVLCLSSTNKNAVQSIRQMYALLADNGIQNPSIITTDSNHNSPDESLIHYAVEAGTLLLDGMGNGISLGHHYGNAAVTTHHQWLNSIAFGILQATRSRISKTEYISCPSCGRTLFDLQLTTARIRSVTNHLKGVKIAIMGCIVNGPGEMADADFGYVGSGVGKITLYKGKEVVKRNIDSDIAVDALVSLLKENGAWVAAE